MKILPKWKRDSKHTMICPQCKLKISDDGNGQLDDHIRWHDRQ